MTTGNGKNGARTRMNVTASSCRTSLAPIRRTSSGAKIVTSAPAMPMATRANTSPVRRVSLAVCRSSQPSFMPMMHWQPTQMTTAQAIKASYIGMTRLTEPMAFAPMKLPIRRPSMKSWADSMNRASMPGMTNLTNSLGIFPLASSSSPLVCVRAVEFIKFFAFGKFQAYRLRCLHGQRCLPGGQKRRHDRWHE